MTKRRSAPGQLAMPGFIPNSFWVTTQGHGVIPDGRRFLVVEDYGGGHWLAWENGVAPLHPGGDLLREQDFRREVESDDDFTS